MKTFKSFVLILLIGFIFNSCEIDPNHSIRIKNEYPATINNLKIGSVSYGSVANGATTEYKPVEDGSHSISGSINSSKTITGTVSVKGTGTHKWTVKITTSGGAVINED
jgi:hypothetical protein